MNDHNLDDLIIGETGSGKTGSKTVLSIVALAIVVLIVGLILWALLFGSSDQGTTADTPLATANQTQALDPGLTPLETDTNDIPPLTPEPNDQSPAPASGSKPLPKPKPTLELTPDTTPAAEPVETPTPSATPSRPKPPAHNTPPARTTPSIPAGSQLIKTADQPIYYVQVGAFKHAPSPHFMQKLKDGGFTFITKITRGIRRVRVGPYDSYREAKAALPIIKKKIGVDGIIVKY